STQQLVELIRNVGRKPIERDTLYHVVTDYSDIFFEDTKKPNNYKLPVVSNV
ncbi:MAG: aminofutalosine synthase MqnE, partial [Pedobacter sp.]|nr:aminofutalosine synthase MqnE [Pedobacter sp.]